MKGLMILADGFEVVEALATRDVLNRAEIALDLISITSSLEVKSSHNVFVKADALMKSISLNDYEFLVVPGGPGVFINLVNNTDVKETIKTFIKEDKLVAAICAAPVLLKDFEEFKEKRFTVFPGLENDFTSSIFVKTENVVMDNKFITAKSMFYTIPFALKIVEFLKGKEFSNKVENALKGQE